MRRHRFHYAQGVIILALLAMGCNFNSGGLGADVDANPNALDADPNAPDAAPVDFCGWSFNPVHFDPCTQEPPAGMLEPLVLTQAASPYTYDSFNDGTLTDTDGFVQHYDPQIGDNMVIFASEITIEAGAELRVTGPRPVVLVSTSSFTVLGVINASSYWDEGMDDYNVGTGAQPEDCTTPPEAGAQAGYSCTEGGGGGGGAGLGGVGGVGGDGADNRDCVDQLGAPGGNGGKFVEPSTTLRGGCGGEDGGMGNDEANFGIGGAGGGAIHLTARTLLELEGQIHAGGAGGRGGAGNRSAGGGGGSGGMIGLEAQSLTLQAGVVLAANGGGGGGGGNNVGQPGEDAPVDGIQAMGGMGEGGQGGDGGHGGHGTSRDGFPGGLAPSRGGGGGGGAAGFIVYYGVAPTGSATRISPAPTTIP